MIRSNAKVYALKENVKARAMAALSADTHHHRFLVGT